MSCSLSPVLGGEGWGEGSFGEWRNFKIWPLTLTLSPEYRGEGTKASRSYCDSAALATCLSTPRTSNDPAPHKLFTAESYMHSPRTGGSTNFPGATARAA